MLYEIHYVGGPDDGNMVSAFRPYYALHESKTGHTYCTDSTIESEWVDDETRKITLFYKGVLTQDEFRELGKTC